MPHSAGGRPPPDKTIRTLDDVHAALAHFVKELADSGVLSVATHVATDIAFRPVTDREMAEALARRDRAGPVERDMYASYINEAFLSALEPHAGRIAFQFSYAAEPLPYNTASLIPQRALADFAEMAARHPKVRFNCFVGSRHANQTLCTFCRGLPNVSLSAYWWHNFFPLSMRQIMEERLDMLPANRQVGFFSDAYCIEWTYAKAEMVRREWAAVLAEKIARGQYTRDEALAISKAVMHDCARDLFGMRAT